ncbi:hypothetical protein KSP40_PGU000804 [Platanthera guangdongensis]|uniref:Uncharacterized protein n=1 Tax=Platanthera guangdongensis TaxID=2320717 RepID=A0ABR2MKJ1_9ASPA
MMSSDCCEKTSVSGTAGCCRNRVLEATAGLLQEDSDSKSEKGSQRTKEHSKEETTPICSVSTPTSPPLVSKLQLTVTSLAHLDPLAGDSDNTQCHEALNELFTVDSRER